MTLSLCIVGCGSYARSVLNVVHDMTDEYEFYFASRDGAKAKEYCESFGGAGYFGSYEGAAADPRVQAMYFFTPHDMHPENVRLAARHSKHVLVEKPIARTVEEAREMVGVARGAGVKLMVAENYRFLPTVARVNQLLDEGAYGELRLIQVYNEDFRESPGWRASVESRGGGVFIDGGIHGVDILVNVGGFPERVFAMAPPQVHRNMDGEDGMVMMAGFPGGAVGFIYYSSSHPTNKVRQQVSVTFATGEISFDTYGSELRISTRDGESSEQLDGVRREDLRRMLREFRVCIAEDREPVMSGHEATKDLEVVLAAYRSAATGTQVTPDLP
jgi:predicted dehydrogenase